MEANAVNKTTRESQSGHSPAELSCHICDASGLVLLTEYDRLPRVTSDSLPYPAGGKLGICNVCGTIQNPVDLAWQLDTASIYSKYDINPQSGGGEQFVFGAGNPAPRSAKLFEQVTRLSKLPELGRLLDVGCANGILLRTFGKLAPKWTMVGFEVDEKHRADVESIEMVESFHSGSLDSVPGKFNMVTIIHVLEHLSYPGRWLAELRQRMEPGALLLVQVPDIRQNPFFLQVADHCSHFTLPTLANLIVNAGFETIAVSSDWIPRELSVLATPSSTKASAGEKALEQDSAYDITKALSWLHSTADAMRTCSEAASSGIFGSAITATWLYGVVDGKLDFFVDEDPSRVGRTHLGKPIYAPSEVPAGSHVFVGLSPVQAKLVAERLASPDVHYHLPPPFPWGY